MSDSDDFNDESFIDAADNDGYELKLSKNFDGLDALISIVSSDEDVDKIVEEFTKNDISYATLAALNDKDLELLGVKHQKSRDELLQSFAELPNQREHYEEVLGNLNRKDYNELVLAQVLNHMKDLNISLTAAQLRLQLDHPEDVIMDKSSVHSSVLVGKTLDELKRNAELMEVQLIELQTGKVYEKKKSAVNGKLLKIALFLTGISIFSFITFSICKSKNIPMFKLMMK